MSYTAVTLMTCGIMLYTDVDTVRMWRGIQFIATHKASCSWTRGLEVRTISWDVAAHRRTGWPAVPWIIEFIYSNSQSISNLIWIEIEAPCGTNFFCPQQGIDVPFVTIYKEILYAMKFLFQGAPPQRKRHHKEPFAHRSENDSKVGIACQCWAGCCSGAPHPKDAPAKNIHAGMDGQRDSQWPVILNIDRPLPLNAWAGTCKDMQIENGGANKTKDTTTTSRKEAHTFHDKPHEPGDGEQGRCDKILSEFVCCKTMQYYC